MNTEFILNDHNDRRKDNRYEIKGIAFAVLKSNSEEELGQIINISRGGLAFQYFVGSRRIEKAKQLDIMLTKKGVYINKINIRTVSDFEIVNELPFSTIAKRQQSVCFDQLTEEQQNQLELIITNHVE